MLGYAPRGSQPLCSNWSDAGGGIIARARRALSVVVKQLRSRFRITDRSVANPWRADD